MRQVFTFDQNFATIAAAWGQHSGRVTPPPHSIIDVLHVDLNAEQFASSTWCVCEFQDNRINEESFEVLACDVSNRIDHVFIDAGDVLSADFAARAFSQTEKRISLSAGRGSSG